MGVRGKRADSGEKRTDCYSCVLLEEYLWIGGWRVSLCWMLFWVMGCCFRVGKGRMDSVELWVSIGSRNQIGWEMRCGRPYDVHETLNKMEQQSSMGSEAMVFSSFLSAAFSVRCCWRAKAISDGKANAQRVRFTVMLLLFWKALVGRVTLTRLGISRDNCRVDANHSQE